MVWLNRVLFASVGLFIVSCTINSNEYIIKGVGTSPGIAVPLAFGDLSIADLLSKKDSAYVKVQPDGLIYLSYNQFLASQDIRNLIKIPDVGTINTPLAIPPRTYPPSPADVIIAGNNDLVDLGLKPETLNEIGFKSGVLTYSSSLSQPNPNLKYSILISIPEFISKSSSTFLSKEVSGSGTIQLSDYIFKSIVANKFNLNLSLIIKKSSTSIIIAPGTTVDAKVSFGGMDFTYVKGFFGDQTVTAKPQTLNIEAFGSSLSNGANISFAQPAIGLTVINEYGVPLEVNFIKLEAQKNGSALPMQINPVNPISINKPTSLGSSANTTVNVTNVAALVNFAPTKFYYQVSGRINNGFQFGVNFMADTSKMKVRMQIDIPLYGKASNIVIADTVDADLGNVEGSKIETASLKTNVTNQLPLDASLQFYFLDKNNKVLDSLLDSSQSNIVKGSIVSATGDLQTASISEQLITLNPSKIQNVFACKKIIIKAKMNTSKDATGSLIDVKFKASYKIDIKLGLLAKLKIVSSF